MGNSAHLTVKALHQEATRIHLGQHQMAPWNRRPIATLLSQHCFEEVLQTNHPWNPRSCNSWDDQMFQCVVYSYCIYWHNVQLISINLILQYYLYSRLDSTCSYINWEAALSHVQFQTAILFTRARAFCHRLSMDTKATKLIFSW